VVASDGFTYEKEALEGLFKNSNPALSPATGEVLEKKHFMNRVYHHFLKKKSLDLTWNLEDLKKEEGKFFEEVVAFKEYYKNSKNIEKFMEPPGLK
jgi:hypothetical protein